MRVLLVNGSPHPKGCTYTALQEVGSALNSEGIDNEIFFIGAKAIASCRACGKCRELGRCVIGDSVNAFAKMAQTADGFIFGSPVHFASATGAITSFMDRLFYSDLSARKEAFYLKPAAAVVSARRAGTTATFDQLIKHFTLLQMPIISSQYWNMVHGNTPEEVLQDKEGLQIMRTLGRNMAWFLKCKEAGAAAGVPLPEREPRRGTNFIR